MNPSVCAACCISGGSFYYIFVDDDVVVDVDVDVWMFVDGWIRIVVDEMFDDVF